MGMNKAIVYLLAAMSIPHGSITGVLAIRTTVPVNENPKQSFKQNRRKELTKSRKKRNKQF